MLGTMPGWPDCPHREVNASCPAVTLASSLCSCRRADLRRRLPFMTSSVLELLDLLLGDLLLFLSSCSFLRRRSFSDPLGLRSRPMAEGFRLGI